MGARRRDRHVHARVGFQRGLPYQAGARRRRALTARKTFKSRRPIADLQNMTQPPFVSVLVTALDAAEGLAASLDSALAQDYPTERLEVVVVDDGENDVSVGYAELFPDRLRVILQPGASAVAATARAFGEARGDVLALLEPGDRWPVGRISAQVAALDEWADVGLVYSEPVTVEGDPPAEWPVARLLCEPPCIAPSSIALRAGLLPALGELPAELPRAAWWLAVRAASLGEIAWVPAGVAPVDSEASDDGVDAGGPRDGDATATREDALRESLAVQRWFLRTATSESLYADRLGEIWRAFMANARRLRAAAGDDPFTELVTVTDADRSAARRALADARDALAHGDTWPAAALAVRAAALDPSCAPARELLAETLAARPRRVAGDPLAGARRFVTLAFAEELLQHRELLAAYGARFDGNADATLAIDASTLLPAAAGQALGALVSDLGLDADGTAHLIAVLGPIDASVRAGLPERADALLTLRESASAAAAVPAFGADSIEDLHALVRHATAA
ncbi:MAG TPA: glycosyltransferase family A protein [Conexibacter sp.]|nr:glycosyltransferase family A protein [Conexibacter sp.]